jgi:hypothetical protein
MAKSVGYSVCSSIGNTNCFWPKVAVLMNVVQEHVVASQKINLYGQEFLSFYVNVVQ